MRKKLSLLSITSSAKICEKNSEKHRCKQAIAERKQVILVQNKQTILLFFLYYETSAF